MKFRDPWIDPRITQLVPAEAKAYLESRGWKSLGPASNPILEMFERPGDREDPPSGPRTAQNGSRTNDSKNDRPG
jgi:hypothetical protein